MKIRFLVSVPVDGSVGAAGADGDGGWTTGTFPVVPCFPPQSDRAFLCLGSWKLAREAEVAEIDVDPDELAAEMARQYPGIPRTMHDAYIMHTFEAAARRSVGDRVRVLVSQDKATLVNVGKPGVEDMWTSKPGVSVE